MRKAAPWPQQASDTPRGCEVVRLPLCAIARSRPAVGGPATFQHILLSKSGRGDWLQRPAVSSRNQPARLQVRNPSSKHLSPSRSGAASPSCGCAAATPLVRPMSPTDIVLHPPLRSRGSAGHWRAHRPICRRPRGWLRWASLVAPTGRDNLIEHPRHMREKRRSAFGRDHARVLQGGRLLLIWHGHVLDLERA